MSIPLLPFKPEKTSLNKVVLIGKMRSGKDTLADYLCKKHSFKRYAFGDALKYYYHAIFGKTDTKPRQGYQIFGQTMRQHDPDVWVRKVFEKINAEKPNKAVITDCRQPNEYERAAKENFLIVRVDCDEATRIKRMERAGDVFTLDDLRHETETALDDYPVHFTVSNAGTVEEMIYMFEQAITQYR